ncbi:hypothetical protein QN362_01200 [Actimicrobium sp. CCC2.4]|uniref:hypothetical protein n=1 Tax=Actimicrobium sp. CCC2.4 TaxID=3048606 RepID=UPI002AC897CD|nr:hypothetical protein [Actimicrobium sp. CCC2.4]MEB0133940.1 hypothetical protein [Actimicrobium sp. CCC2.4]WPX31480.1 hypothetical protein RHM62_14680 [Actimicrobium sp. CCC2.4]
MNISSLVLLITTASLLASASVHATEPSASASGNVAIQNTIKGNISLGTNGSSTSFARNAEAATAKVGTSANYQPHFREVNASTAGQASTDSAGMAYNTSTGSGYGTASSMGSARTLIAGSTAIHGVTQGLNGGSASVQTDNRIVAGTNQGSYAEGQTKSGFDLQLHYTRNAGPSSVSISDDKSGFVSAANSSGALKDMNAAGVASIGSAGQFFVRANLAGSTGSTSAP